MAALKYPTDTEGRQCGRNKAVSNKSFLLYFDWGKCINLEFAFNGCQTSKVCVEKCPTENFSFNETTCKLNIQEIREKLICKFDVNVKEIKTCKEISEYIANETCAKGYWKSSNPGIFDSYAF